MTTALDLITDAATKARIYSPGESMPSYHSAGMFRELNRMLGSWANETFLIYGQTEETLNLTANKSSYTIGNDAAYDFNTIRPQEILEGSFIRETSGNTDYPLKIKSLKEYRDIADKSTESIPYQIAYNSTYPYGTIYLFWSPSSAYELHLLSLKEITAFATLTTTVSLPPGYEDAIIYNLALRIGPDYGKTIRPDIVALAENGIKLLKRRNIKRLPPTRLEVGAFVNSR